MAATMTRKPKATKTESDSPQKDPLPWPMAASASDAAPKTDDPGIADPKTMAQRLDAIGSLGKQIQKMKRAVDRKEADVSTAKGVLDDRREELSDLNKELRELQDELDGFALGKFPEKLFPSAKQPDGTKTEPAAVDESWRAVTLKEVGINGKLGEKLEQADLPNLGAIADFTRRCRLTEVDGVGEAAAKKIEDAIDAYWARNPAYKKPAASENPAEQTEPAKPVGKMPTKPVNARVLGLHEKTIRLTLDTSAKPGDKLKDPEYLQIVERVPFAHEDQRWIATPGKVAGVDFLLVPLLDGDVVGKFEDGIPVKL